MLVLNLFQLGLSCASSKKNKQTNNRVLKNIGLFFLTLKKMSWMQAIQEWGEGIAQKVLRDPGLFQLFIPWTLGCDLAIHNMR